MILKKLKEGTADCHEQLEQTVDIPSRLADRFLYERLLRAFYGFYAPIEDRLRFYPPENGFAPEERFKTPLLERDLRALGGADFDPSQISVCRDLPPLEDFAQALGCWYVLEGATLGGQLISRDLRRRLDLTPSNGAAFFASYGERVGAMWKAFGAMAEAAAEKLDADERVVESARATFTKFENWLKATA